MDPTTGTYDYSTETLLSAKATEAAELRELLLLAVTGDLEALGCAHPDWASRLLARAQRLRRRLHEAGS